MKNSLLLSLCLSLLSGLAHAQLDANQNEPKEYNFLPPSPTASELGKYGFMTTGMHTGAAQASIPLFQLQSRDLSLPVGLSYSSNGVKVDQIASNVGMGWSLQAGGVVTRIVRDEPDESSNFSYPQNLDEFNPETADYLLKAVEPHNRFDTEPDLYSFNFAGYSGQFVYNDQKQPFVFPHQKIKIERGAEGNFTTFIITTPDGVKYTFGGSTATERTKTSPYGGSACGKSFDMPEETSWYLTAIEHPSGDYINFSYESHYFTYDLSVTQTDTKLTNPNDACNGENTCSPGSFTTCYTSMENYGVVLTGITAASGMGVEVHSASGSTSADRRIEELVFKNKEGDPFKKVKLNYLPYASASNRLFLEKLTETNSMETTHKLYTFEYYNPAGLPSRLSYSQDHWGYYNGKVNNGFLPKVEGYGDLFADRTANREADTAFSYYGMLKKITYPTGGYDKFTYEGNAYYGQKTVYPSPVRETLATRGKGFKECIEKAYTVTLAEGQEVTYNASALYTKDDDQHDATHEYAEINIYNVSLERYELSNYRLGDGDKLLNKKIYLNGGYTYEFKLEVCGGDYEGSFDFTYYKGTSFPMNVNLPTGGIRVARIVKAAGFGSPLEIKKFYYATLNNPAQSSGVKGYTPKYVSDYFTRLGCGDGDVPGKYSDCPYTKLSSNSLVNLYPFNGSNVQYRFVSIGYGENFENGAEEYEYTISYDKPGRQVWGELFDNGGFSNSGWDTGMLKQHKKFEKKTDGSLAVVYEKVNEYTTDSRLAFIVKGLVAQKRYEPVSIFSEFYTCTEEDVKREYKTYRCVAEHSVSINGVNVNYGHAYIQGSNWCIFGGKKYNEPYIYYESPCFGEEEGTVIEFTRAIEHIDAMEYYNRVFWSYLSKTTERTYANGNTFEKVVTYGYDNPEHAQLSWLKMTDSHGSVVETKYYYPEDYHPDIENIELLVNDKFMVGQPVMKLVNQGATSAKGMVFKYTDFGKLKEIHSLSNSSASTIAFDPETYVPAGFEKVVEYSYAGSIVKEALKRDGVKQSFIWDATFSRPIASVVNASQEQAFFTSFEDHASALEDESQAKTGKKYFSGSYTVPVPAEGSYVLSYWKKTAAANEWELVINENVKGNQTIGGAGIFLDEVRLHPKGTLMTTYTYKEGVGPSSVTDPNHVTTYYEYDDLNRLKLAKDDAHNILQKVDYHYVNESLE